MKRRGEETLFERYIRNRVRRERYKSEEKVLKQIINELKEKCERERLEKINMYQNKLDELKK